MAWLDEPGLERRPVVFVEDHLYHTADLLAQVLLFASHNGIDLEAALERKWFARLGESRA